MSANIHKAAWAPNRRRIAKSAAHPLRLEVKLRQSEMQYLRQMQQLVKSYMPDLLTVMQQEHDATFPLRLDSYSGGTDRIRRIFDRIRADLSRAETMMQSGKKSTACRPTLPHGISNSGARL